MNPKIDILPSCKLALDLSNGYMNTTGTKKVFDHSQYNNHGTVIGALPRYPGFYFDGLNDYVNCGSKTSLNITDAITIEAWVKPIVSDANVKQIIIRGWNINRIYIQNTNELKTYNVIGGGDTLRIISNAFPTVDGSRWYHIVYSYKSGDENIYIDGVNRGHWTPIGVLSTSASPLLIGIYTDKSSNPFNGAIDEVRIWNEALTPLEVKNHYELSRWRHGV